MNIIAGICTIIVGTILVAIISGCFINDIDIDNIRNKPDIRLTVGWISIIILFIIWSFSLWEVFKQLNQ